MNKAVKIILAFGAVSVALFFFVIPWILTWVDTQPIWVSFIIFYFFFFTVLSAVLYFIISKNKKNFVHSLRFASASTFIIMAIDLYLPAWAVDSQGNLLASDTIGYLGSVDFVVAFFWSGMGISGPLLLFVTYVLTGMMLLTIAFAIMGTKSFVSNVKRVIT